VVVEINDRGGRKPRVREIEVLGEGKRLKERITSPSWFQKKEIF